MFLYLHGGGCCLLAPEAYEGITTALAARADCIVVAPAYRLAPEHAFPAALDDCGRVYTWLVEDGRALGADPTRIVVGGDSAGGYLATALCLDAKRRSEPQPLRQLLAYPNTDFRPEGDGDAATDLTKWLAALYVGPDGHDPRASPILATDLHDVAPVTLVSAEHDELNEEGLAYARALRESGVPVVHQVYLGTVHGFLSMGGAASIARLAVRHLAASARAAFAGDDQSSFATGKMGSL